MKKILFVVFTSIVCFLSSCSDSGRFLPTITGSTFDLLVVGSDPIWKSEAGRTIDSVFGGPMPALPQEEPFFKVIHLKRAYFDNTVNTARNIVFYDVDPNKYTKGSLHFEENAWAKPQAIVHITAPDVATLDSVVSKNCQQLRRYFTVAEEKRARNYFTTYQNRDFAENVMKRFGVSMLVPLELTVKRDTTNFVWMSNGSNDISQNMCVFTSPYTSNSDFSAEHLVAVQDYYTSKYVPGPSEGSFMNHQPLEPLTYEVLKNDYSDFCVEVRGLWHCEKDVMGGPFVSRNYLSADHKSIITAMVFLYAPGKDKRNRLRMLEGAAGSLCVKPAKTDSTASK